MTSLLLVEFDWNTALIRFSVNTFFIASMILIISKQMVLRRFSFSFLMISLIVFFLCFTLKNFDLNLGMALGLFAIFGIIRYRTDPIPIKEMTYLFLVIGVSVINALANKKISYSELVFANLLIVAVTYGLEKIWLLRHETRKNIIYEKIDLIGPEKRQELLADLKNRTGIDVVRVEIRRVDFLKDIAYLRIFYYEND